MITEKQYKQKPLTFWNSKKVETLVNIGNGYYAIPAGTVLEITNKYQGFTLRGLDVCPHCKIGRKIDISRVEPTALRLLPEPERSGDASSEN